MATYSFDCDLATDSIDRGMPAGGYSVKLHGDAGAVTRFETNSVMNTTPRTLLQAVTSADSCALNFEVKDKYGESDHLRSKHYVWKVARCDGEPMLRNELQLALMLYSMERSQELIIEIPRGTLNTLLSADQSLSQALVAAMAVAAPGQRNVLIQDQSVAAKLVDLGLITPTETGSEYALMDIALS